MAVAWGLSACPLAVWAQANAGNAIPKLATGSLELEWIDQHYPETGDQKARRRALDLAVSYFPDDKQTDIRAGARLGLIDWKEGRLDSAHGRFSGLLLDGPRGLDSDTYAWVEILDARVLIDLRRSPEALALLENVAANEGISPARRAMAASDAGTLILSRSPSDSLALLKSISSLPGGATEDVEAGIVHALLVAGRDDEAAAEFSNIAATRSSGEGEKRLAAILSTLGGWNLPGDELRINRVVDLTVALVPEPGKVLSDALASCRLEVACRLIRQRLLRVLAAEPLSTVYSANLSDGFATAIGFQRAVDQAYQQGDPRRCLRLSLHALAVPGDNANFPRRLWEAASYADWAERKVGRSFDSRICDVLLDLCDQLPGGQDFWIEGKFLRAERRARAGDRNGEQAMLNQVISISGLRPSYLAPACKRLGASLEAVGEDQKALEIYLLSESAEGYAKGIDCLLHAVLINLRLGEDEEALRLIGILQGASVDAVSGSTSPFQIRELCALAKTGNAVEFWRASRKWWPRWQQLQKARGEMLGLTDERVPVIPNLSAFLEETRHAAEAGESADFFRRYGILLSASRWEPSVGPEVAAISAAAFHYAPESREEFRRLLVSVLECPHPPEIPNLRKRKLFLADNYLNLQMPDKVLVLASEFDALGVPEDYLDPAMHELQGLAALDAGRNYEVAAGALESDLSRADPGGQRAMVDGLLAELYHRLGRDNDARRLLKVELANPKVAADAVGHADLARRYAGLSVTSGIPLPKSTPTATRATSSPSRNSTAASSDDWIRSVSSDWFDFAEPHDLDDPRLKNIDDAIRDPGGIFPPAGQVKFLLLAARDPRLSSDQRQRALVEAAVRLVLSSPTYRRMADLTNSAISQPSFDDDSRLRVLWTALAVLSEDGRRSEYDVLRNDPLCSHFSPGLQRQLALLDLEVNVDRTSPVGAVRLATSLGVDGLNWAGVQTMSDLFGVLLRIGDVKDAQSLADTMPSWKLTSDAVGRVDPVRLDFARRLRTADVINPVHEAMAASLLKNYPNVPAELPIELRDARVSGRLPARAAAPTFQACEYLAATRQFDRSDLAFWGTVFGSFPHGSNAAAAITDLLHSGLAAAGDDELRSELIVSFFSSADIDDPSIRRGAEKEFAAYRKPADCPLCYLVIRLYEIHRSLRLGEPTTLEAVYADLNDPRVKIVQERDSLRYYTQVGDRVSLQRTIKGVDSGTLLSPGFVAQAIPALAFLGLEPELNSARKAALRAMNEDIVESWALGVDSAAGAALDLALVLRDPAAMPQAWVRDMGWESEDPLLRQRILMVNAYLQSDWSGTEAAAALLNRDYPTRYSFYWYRGYALHQLGRDAEAAGALATYVQHAKDEIEYPKALELLNAIGTARARATVSAQ